MRIAIAAGLAGGLVLFAAGVEAKTLVFCSEAIRNRSIRRS